MLDLLLAGLGGTFLVGSVALAILVDLREAIAPPPRAGSGRHASPPAPGSRGRHLTLVS